MRTLSLALRDNHKFSLSKWYTTRTVLTEWKFPTEISEFLFINYKQPVSNHLDAVADPYLQMRGGGAVIQTLG